MISMSIFAVMSVIIMSVYIQTTNTARKMNATRELSETAREITERIAQDVRKKGIDTVSELDTSPSAYILWTDQSRYTDSGSEYLSIVWWPTYVYGKKTPEWVSPCIDTAKTDNKIHCGLYLSNGTEYYNLVDSFVPEESKKRVKITDFRFYISGWESTTKKVTLTMTLALMPRIWVPASMIENTKLHIQTTISEQGWKR